MVEPLINIPPPYYGWISRIFAVIGFICAILTIIWHIDTSTKAIYRSRGKNQSNYNSKTRTHSISDRDQSIQWKKFKRRSSGSKQIQCNNSLKFTFVLQFAVLVTLIGAVYGTCFSTPTEWSCIAAIHTSLAGYLVAKWALYMVLSFRLDAAFGDSSLAYKKSTLTIWRILLTICVIIELYFAFRYTKVEIIEADKQLPCRGSGETTVVAGIMILVDIVAGCGNCLMFIGPLKRINKVVFGGDISDKGKLFNITKIPKINVNVNDLREMSQSVSNSLKAVRARVVTAVSKTEATMKNIVQPAKDKDAKAEGKADAGDNDSDNNVNNNNDNINSHNGECIGHESDSNRGGDVTDYDASDHDNDDDDDDYNSDDVTNRQNFCFRNQTPTGTGDMSVNHFDIKNMGMQSVDTYDSSNNMDNNNSNNENNGKDINTMKNRTPKSEMNIIMEDKTVAGGSKLTTTTEIIVIGSDDDVQHESDHDQESISKSTSQLEKPLTPNVEKSHGRSSPSIARNPNAQAIDREATKLLVLTQKATRLSIMAVSSTFGGVVLMTVVGLPYVWYVMSMIEVDV